MNKRFCPAHLRGLPVGRSYHDGGWVQAQADRLVGEKPSEGRIIVTGHKDGSISDKALDDLYNAPAGKLAGFDFNFDIKPSKQVRSYDDTVGVAALLREHFGFERLEKIAKEPNEFLKQLRFKNSNEPTLRYVKETDFAPFPSSGELYVGGKPIGKITDIKIQPRVGGTVTGRTSHLVPNPPAVPRRHPHIEEIPKMHSQPPKSSQPQRDMKAFAAALDAGRDKPDAELIAECACQPGSDVEQLLTLDFMELMKRVSEWRAVKDEFEQRFKDSLKSQPIFQPYMQSVEPPYSGNAMIESLRAGLTMDDAKVVGELALTVKGWTVSELIHMDRTERSNLLAVIRRNAAKDKIDPPRDTCNAEPPSTQADPRIKISVYLDDGVVFDYDVTNATSAREHVSAIIKTGYRHSDSSTPDELTHFPPHRILKVKMRGPGITTMYYDRPRGT